MPKGIYLAPPVAEDSGVVILHRVIGKDASDSDTDLLVAADVSSVAITVVKKSDGTTVTTAAPSPASVFPSTVRTVGGVGYNFVYETTAAMLPDGDQIYRFEIKLTPVSGAQFYLDVVEVPTIAVIG